MNKECCENCAPSKIKNEDGSYSPMPKMACLLSWCPCHSPSSQEKQVEMPDVIKRALENGDAVHASRQPSAEKHPYKPDPVLDTNVCNYCYHSRNDPIHDRPSADWEKEFDHRFANATYSPDGKGCHCNDIKSFIHKFVEQAREENDAWWKDAQKVVRKSGFEAGRTAALKEVVEMIGTERIKLAKQIQSTHFSFVFDDLKQSITKLTEKV